jgi:hypothetical protein
LISFFLISHFLFQTFVVPRLLPEVGSTERIISAGCGGQLRRFVGPPELLPSRIAAKGRVQHPESGVLARVLQGHRFGLAFARVHVFLASKSHQELCRKEIPHSWCSADATQGIKGKRSPMKKKKKTTKKKTTNKTKTEKEKKSKK